MATNARMVNRLGVSMVCLAVCLPSCVSADDDPWLGRTVMLKETAVPQIGTRRVDWKDVGVPAPVEDVRGDWLWLGVAWVKKDEVVLLDDAPAYFTKLVNSQTKRTLGYLLRGISWIGRGENDNAIKDLTAAIRAEPDHMLAALYATAPVFEAHLRDGKQALALAQKSCELSRWDEWIPMTSLAAAYAELGDFEAAVKWETKAMSMMPAKDRLDHQKRLDLYKSGQAYYEEVPALKDDGRGGQSG